MSTPPPPENSNGRALGGIALIVIGLLILVPSGLCTAIFGGSALFDMFSSPSSASEGVSILAEALIVGAVPIAIGVGLIFLGRSLRQRK